MAVEFQVKPVAGKLNIAYPAEHCEKLRSDVKTDAYETVPDRVNPIFILLLSILISLGLIACYDDEKIDLRKGDEDQDDEFREYDVTAGILDYDHEYFSENEETELDGDGIDESDNRYYAGDVETESPEIEPEIEYVDGDEDETTAGIADYDTDNTYELEKDAQEIEIADGDEATESENEDVEIEEPEYDSWDGDIGIDNSYTLEQNDVEPIEWYDIEYEATSGDVQYDYEHTTVK